MTRVSIVMASYNRKDYIKLAVDSILNQTYKDFEFIIIDDCSTDGTREILEDFAQKDCRIKLIKNKENKGLIYNLRLGLSQANGEYIVRMDDDDIAYAERIEKQVKFMDENPEITVCGSFIELIGECENSVGWVKHLLPEEIAILLNFFNPMCHPSVIIRNSFLKKHNINFRFEALHAEEYDLWKQIIFHNGKISNIPEVLLKYRIHKNRISQAEDSAKIQNETAKKGRITMIKTEVKNSGS